MKNIDFVATENGVDIRGGVTLNGSEIQPKMTASDGIEIENNVIKTSKLIEKVETIYDKSSSDSDINWGYTGGIVGGNTIEKDLSKYKYLRVYCLLNNYFTRTFYISVSSPSEIYGVISTESPNESNHNSTLVRMNVSKTSFSISFYIVLYQSSAMKWEEKKSASGYQIYKIEGVY